MRAKSWQKFYRNNLFENIEKSISEYPASKLGPKLNKRYDNIRNLSVLNKNLGIYPKVLSSKNLNIQNLSNKIQYPIAKNLSVLQRPKTEISDIYGSMMSITKQSTSSTNDYTFNFDSVPVSSLGGFNQNKNNSLNKNLGIKVSNHENDFKARNKANFYLSDEDIVNIAMSMNMNGNTNQITNNENFKTNSLTKLETKKNKKYSFDYNDMLINELIDTDILNNKPPTNEGEFTSYCKNISTKIDKPIYINRPQPTLKGSKKNDINLNTGYIKKTSEFKPDLTNILEYSSRNFNYEFNPSNIIETKENSTQTESSDVVLNLSIKINPFETKVQHINL